MAYFTSKILQRYATNNRAHKNVTRNLRIAATDSTQVRIFLSHSHADIADLSHEDVEAVRILLTGHGVDVYIDSEDAAMPGITSSETASILKKRICSCDKFILLATVNARKSKWVPWELGFADEAKGMHNVAIFPLQIAPATGMATNIWVRIKQYKLLMTAALLFSRLTRTPARAWVAFYSRVQTCPNLGVGDEAFAYVSRRPHCQKHQ